MMDKDKAIRAAKLTLGGMLEKNRAKTAVNRAGGQIAPSKYLPNVPRAVHADGGRENGEVVNLGKEKLVRSITKAVSDVKSGAHQERMDQRAYKLHESGHLPLPIGTKVTPPQGWDMPSQLQIHGYWQDILHPEQHGYKLKSEDGDLYDVQHHRHSGKNPYIFGGGFKAYSGPVRNRAEYSNEAMASKNLAPSAKTPEQYSQINAEYDQLFGTDPDITKAEGGRVGYADGGRKLNEHGFYSKALEAARNMQQEKGTPEQFMAQLKNTKGVKQSELDSIGMPNGDKITREDFVRHISSNLPRLGMSQLGADPSFLSAEDQKFLRYATNNKNLTPEEDEKRRSLDQRRMRNIGHSTDDEGNSETNYPDYITGGGKNYRERLIKLTREKQYQSSHWDDANVLAHVRMQDRIVGGGRDEMRPVIQKLANHLGVGLSSLSSGSAAVGVKNGVISPEEAATLSRLMRWQNGYESKKGVDKKLLHVEEIQSDWGQEGRKDGFHDPKNPYEVVRKDTKEVVSRHPDYGSMWDAYRTHPDSDNLTYGDVRNEKPPEAPFVQNTQHWTDLAMKQILREAALGDYDGIVFTPGQAQADRYGLDKKVQSLSLSRPQDGSKFGRLVARDVFGGTIHNSDIADEKELHGLIGKDMGEKLLSASPVANSDDQTFNHQLEGDDLKMGGEGMKNYYDKIVPKSAMNLVRQHDPSAQPQSMNINGEYDALHIPLSSTAKESIVKNGFQMFNKGGAVEARTGYGDGGIPQQNGEPNVGTEVAPNDIATRPQAGGLPIAGGVRGSSGVLQTQNEAPLEGLPTKVGIPFSGGSITAGPDPRIRQVARDYMAQSGLPYNPPTKYAKVDPKRAARIALSYEDMKDDYSDPLTNASYDAMIKETMAQYKAAKDAGFKVDFWHPDKQEDPYKASPRLATEDVRNNHHMWVYPTYAGYGSGDPISEDDAKKNPLLQLTGETWNGIPVTVNDVFRAVHDYYGHAKEGVGFRGDGEENAWRAHASMFSPLARMAMTSETRGQNSWLNYGPHGEKNRTARTEDTIFAPQKIGVMDHSAHHDGAEDFMNPDEIKEMSAIRKRYGRSTGGAVDSALSLTRRFTKNGIGATMTLKPRGN